ncbi:MAG: exopolysaccharide biosynthesis polyprenyl glycosylphosphotransferase [Bilifractor sp.]
MYHRAPKGLVKHWDFALLDVACLELSYVIGYYLRHGLFHQFNQTYRLLSVAFLFIDLLSFLILHTFHKVLQRGYLKEFIITMQQTFLVIGMATLYLFAIHQQAVLSRLTLFYTAVLYFLTSYLTRLLRKKHLKKTSIGSPRSILLITVSSRLENLVRGIERDGTLIYSSTGIILLDAEREGEDYHGIKIVANAKDAIEYLSYNWVDEVLFDIPESFPYPKEISEEAIQMGITVHKRLTYPVEASGAKQFVEKIGDHEVLTSVIAEAPLSELVVKRIADIIGGIIGCIITLILTIIVGPMIKIASPDGPVFFHQTRIGKNGKKFEMYKFRSMYPDAEERKKALLEENRVKDGMMFKLEYDPRIIGCRKMPDGTIKKGIGNWIRDLSIDEFPQFFNVLKGDMSLVGTRPPTVDEWEKYKPYHRSRMAVKPGITGMWQVSGRSSITDFNEVVKLDRKYIENWSIGMDIRILCKTFYVVFARKGAM